MAIHLLYSQAGILEDGFPSERHIGTSAGDSWTEAAEATVVYQDLGITHGMQANIDKAKTEGRKVEHRNLPNYNGRFSGTHQ